MKALREEFGRDLVNHIVYGILLFMDDHSDRDTTMTEMVGNYNLCRASIWRYLGFLESYGIIKETRIIGRKKFYKINMENPEAVALLNAFKKIRDGEK